MTGTAEKKTDDLQAGRRPAAMQPDEATVYAFCHELRAATYCIHPGCALSRQTHRTRVNAKCCVYRANRA